MVVKALLGLLVALIMPALVAVVLGTAPTAYREPLQSWSTDGEESLNVSSDGQWFALRSGESKALPQIEGLDMMAGGSHTHLTLYRATEREPLRTLAVHGVRQVAWHSSTHMLATGGKTFTLQLWDTRDGSLRMILPNPIIKARGDYQTIASLAFSSDGNYLAYGAETGIVRLWRVSDSTLLYNFENVGDASAVTVSPDNQFFCAAPGGPYRAATCWRSADGQRALLLNSGGGQPTALAFSPDGRWLCVGYQDSGQGRVELWRVDQAPARLEHSLVTGDWIFSVAFSPDGRFLAAGGGPYVPSGWLAEGTGTPPSARLNLWRLDTARAPVLVQQAPTGQQFIRSLAFTPDSRRILVSGTGSVRLFRFAQQPTPWWPVPASAALSGAGWLGWVGWLWRQRGQEAGWAERPRWQRPSDAHPRWKPPVGEHPRWTR